MPCYNFLVQTAETRNKPPSADRGEGIQSVSCCIYAYPNKSPVAPTIYAYGDYRSGSTGSTSIPGSSGCMVLSYTHLFVLPYDTSWQSTVPPSYDSSHEATSYVADIIWQMMTHDDCSSIAEITFPEYCAFRRGHSPCEKFMTRYTS